MSVSLQSVHANRDYFAHKLHAEKQRNDVLKAVEGGKFDFVLLDTRGREPFANGYIPGAWCAPAEEIDKGLRRCRRTRSWSLTVEAMIDSFPPR